jgi:hypothetical protein
VANIPSLALGLWALSIIAQLAVLTLLLAKGHFRGLPLFTIYIILNLCQAGLLIIVYSRLFFDSHDAQVLFWFSEGITLIAQAFAATEVLHRVLRPYRGIWGLAWRLLTITSSAVVLYVAASAKQDPDWLLMITSRGFHLTFTVATVSCLLLIRFYEIPVQRVYKALLSGFCLFSCAVVIADTLLPILRARHNALFRDLELFGACGFRGRANRLDRSSARALGCVSRSSCAPGDLRADIPSNQRPATRVE